MRCRGYLEKKYYDNEWYRSKNDVKSLPFAMQSERGGEEKPRNSRCQQTCDRVKMCKSERKGTESINSSGEKRASKFSNPSAAKNIASNRSYAEIYRPEILPFA